MTTAERLLSRVEVDGASGCWNWTACKARNGYGQIRDDGRAKYAHRVSYELHCGSIPARLHVCHRCDNRSCINPAHLFLGTNAENMADKVAKGRQPRGAHHRAAKLADADVTAIRAATGILQRELAAKYGVDQTLISLIRAGKRWAHI